MQGDDGCQAGGCVMPQNQLLVSVFEMGLRGGCKGGAGRGHDRYSIVFEREILLSSAAKALRVSASFVRS